MHLHGHSTVHHICPTCYSVVCRLPLYNARSYRPILISSRGCITTSKKCKVPKREFNRRQVDVALLPFLPAKLDRFGNLSLTWCCTFQRLWDIMSEIESS